MRETAEKGAASGAMIVLDLFAGELGWSKIFFSRGHKCVCVDLVRPDALPSRSGTYGCDFIQEDVLKLEVLGPRRIGIKTGRIEAWSCKPDFIVASSPCEEFSVHGMKHFFPHPKYPELGIKLFNHTRSLCEASGVPYVMENVRAAQQFVGQAVHHCGPWFLWGNSVPPLLHKGIIKGYSMKRETTLLRSRRKDNPHNPHAVARTMATIPAELANCVAAYAERLLEQRAEQRPLHRRENQGADER